MESGAGHRWQYGAIALHTGYLRLQIHTLRLCNTHCFSTATVVAGKGLKFSLHLHCLSCWYLARHGFITTDNNTGMLNAECYMKLIINSSTSANGVTGSNKRITITTLQERVFFFRRQSCGFERCTRRYEVRTKICPRKRRQRNELSHTCVGFCI